MDKTKIAIELFDDYAQLYQDKYMDVSLYHDSFDLFCQCIETENAEVLELACGPGNITQYLLQKRPDFKLLGTDLSPKMIALAKANNPTADFRIMDCRDLHQLTQQYDAVMCGFCLPYLSKEDSIKLISDVADLLNPQGVIYLSTMEDDYEKSGLKGPSNPDEPRQLFMHYHQADYLTSALSENGFNIIDLSRKVYPAADGSMTTDLLIVARK